MNIGEYVLYKDNEYTIDAKTVGGERFKVSRTVRSKGWIKEKEENVTHWVQRSDIQQIMTMIGDDDEMPEEVVIRNYKSEIALLSKEYEGVEEKVQLLAGIQKFHELCEASWSHYYSDFRRGGHRFYGGEPREEYKAQTFPQLMILLAER